MNERKGMLFSIAAENAPVDGCTVSKAVAEVAGRRISHFALAAGTDISPETYDYHKLWIVIDGEGEVLGEKNTKVAKGDAFVTPVGQPVGVAGYKTLSRLPGRGYWRFENSANYGAIAVDAAGHVGGLCGYGTSNAGYNTGKYLWVNCAGYGEIASPVAAGAIVGEINVGNGVNTLAAFSNCWVSAGALFTNCTTACATDNAFAADDPGLAPESALAQMNAWAAGNAGCLPWVAGEASRPEIALFLPNVQLSDVPVLFYGHDGTLLKEETVQPGGVAVPPRAPVREGWHFSGWSGKSAGVTSASVVFAGYSRIGTAPGLCVLLR